jgi:predicted Zn-dependent peptidase
MAGFDLAGMQKRRTILSSLTKKEINVALKKYLDTSKLVISCAGPTNAKAKELKAL